MSASKEHVVERRWDAYGLSCGVVHVNAPFLDHRCGYVRVPSGHPWYGLDDAVAGTHVDVHGGLTYSGHGQFLTRGWWFGFDCAHAYDSAATWTEEAVARETERLAEQLAAVEGSA